MGVSITITDNEFPISPVFVDYVATVIEGGEFATSEWHDQLLAILPVSRNYAKRAF